jgi:ribonuclease HII
MIVKTDPPTLDFEQGLWQSGLCQVAGFDEAGRGAMAGPVAVAAVILLPTRIWHNLAVCAIPNK